ncbi:MAG: type II secretion system major pseudopilin GspG [Bryobacteraceae bacterium]
MEKLVMRTRYRRPAEAGITLIEMLVVVTIIALFAALVGPNLMRQGDKARVTAAKAQVSQLMTALGTYKLETGAYPSTAQGLQALRVAPEGVQQWQGPYLPKEVPNDPWGHPYIYKYPGDHGDDPDIVSLGADGQPGGEGFNEDVMSWK